MFDFEPVVLGLLFIGFIAGHIALFFASRFVNPMYLLASGFMVLSPLSAAVALGPLVFAAKYGRVYLTVLAVAVALFVLRLNRIRIAGALFLIYLALYLAAGVWSEYPLHALGYKGLYAFTVLSGVLTAYAARSMDDLRAGLRAMAVATMAFAALMVFQLLFNPRAISESERLAAFDLNPNRIGETAAMMLILMAYIALYDPWKTLRLAAYGTGIALTVIIMFTGSRGAAGEALIGCFIVGLPLIRRPIFAAGVLAVSFGVVAYVFTSSRLETLSRFKDTSFQTRDQPWAEALAHFADSPLIGKGWIFNLEAGRPTARNMHSIYLQTLAEVGAVGALVMVVCVGAILLHAWLQHRRVLAWTAPLEDHRTTMYLALAFVVAVLAHGVIEASTVMGAATNALALAFGIGLVDRIPELLREREGAWAAAADAESFGSPEGEYDGYDAEPGRV